jgi:chromosome segregation protein
MQQELKAEEAKIDGSRVQSEKQKEDRQAWEIKKAEMDRDLVNLEESCWQELKKTLDEVKSDVSLEDFEKLEVESSLSESNEKLQRISSVNLMAEEEYLIQKKRHDFLVQEQEDLHKSIGATREAIKKIDQESRIQFLQALKEVNKNFKEVFSILFEGGNAEVKLSDPVIVTHNFKTMEVADFIYGTTMAEPSITSMYSVKMDPKTNNLKKIN